MSYDDLIECGSELKVKEAGKARLEGKDYLMQDGDICYFRFNVTKWVVKLIDNSFLSIIFKL